MTRARILADYVAGGTTAAEFDYMDGVTSNVQTQLDAKAPTASPTFTGNFTSVGIDDNADATAITIDSDEKVGIGETSPSYKLDVQSTTSADEVVANFENDINAAGEHALIRCGHGSLAAYMGEYLATNDVAYFSGDSDPANLKGIYVTNADGSVGIGTDTPQAKFHSKATAGWAAAFQNGNSGGYNYQIEFKNSAGTQRGYIRTDESSNVTLYSTSSDYRLKENIEILTNALTRLNQLKPKKFNWIEDPDKTIFDGFIAHEVSSIVPEAIAGEKDEVDDNGDPVFQGIDQSKIVPLIVGAIQELSAKIDALETKVTALENA